MDDELVPMPLAARLAWLLDARGWHVLDARASFAPPLTYEALARELSTSRGYAWQLHRDIGSRLAHSSRLNLLRDLLTTLDAAWPLTLLEGTGDELEEGLEDGTGDELEGVPGEGALPTALHAVQAILDAAGHGPVTAQDAYRLLLLPRALTDRGDARFQARYPRLTHAACSLAPPILAHPAVAARIVRDRWAAARDQRAAARAAARQSHAQTYAALAADVLRAAGAPLHWRDIAARVQARGLRSSVNPRVLCSALGGHAKTFVRVGPGIYALAAWGTAPAPPYPALIARVLREVGQPLAFDGIRRRVEQVRPVKPGTLRTTLSRHARFYRSVKGTYGLRAWLSPGAPEPAPRWWAEDEASARRVARAQSRGGDVACLIAQDAADGDGVGS